MPKHKYNEILGEPSFELMGFRVWIHGRQYPKNKEFWDGNWWRTTIICSSDGASVELSGDILHGSEIAAWLTELKRVSEYRDSPAKLTALERYLKVSVKPQTYQRFSLGVDITPDPTFQNHYFEFWFQDDEIQKLISGCQRTIDKYPIIAVD